MTGCRPPPRNAWPVTRSWTICGRPGSSETKGAWAKTGHAGTRKPTTGISSPHTEPTSGRPVPRTLPHGTRGCANSMEGACPEGQNTGRHREPLRCQTLRGWITHVMAKMARHTLKLLLCRGAGIDGQTFTVTASFHIRRTTSFRLGLMRSSPPVPKRVTFASSGKPRRNLVVRTQDRQQGFGSDADSSRAVRVHQRDVNKTPVCLVLRATCRL